MSGDPFEKKVDGPLGEDMGLDTSTDDTSTDAPQDHEDVSSGDLSSAKSEEESSGAPVDGAGPTKPSSQEAASEQGDSAAGEPELWDANDGVSSPIPPGSKVAGSPSQLSAERPSTVVSIRAVVAAGQRMMALGLLALIGSALLNSVVALRLMLPAIESRGAFLGDGVWSSILGAGISQIGLLVLLPALAWGLSWIIDDRPYRLAFGAAVFVEAWHSVIIWFTAGAGALVMDTVYLAARLVFLVVAALLAGLAFSHGKELAERSDAEDGK